MIANPLILLGLDGSATTCDATSNEAAWSKSIQSVGFSTKNERQPAILGGHDELSLGNKQNVSSLSGHAWILQSADELRRPSIQQ